jgi:hypothetical protein
MPGSSTEETHMDLDDMNGMAVGLFQPLFGLGLVCASPNAMATLSMEEMRQALARHAAGDWGDIGEEDWQRNDKALDTGMRLLSVYTTAAGIGRFWILTDEYRSMTSVLLPGEK